MQYNSPILEALSTLSYYLEQKDNQLLKQHLKQIIIKSAEQRKIVESEFEQLFKHSDDIVNDYTNILKESCETPSKNILQTIATKLILQQNLEIQNGNTLLSIWQEVPVDQLSQFLQKFHIQEQDLQNSLTTPDIRIQTLIQQKKMSEALKLISIFINSVNLLQYMDKYINLDQATEFSKLCEQKKEIVPLFVTQLCQSKITSQQKLATQLIQQYHLDKNSYPDLLKLQNQNAVDKTYFPKIHEYWRAEERLSDFPQMLEHVVNKLIRNNKLDEAYSIVVRHKLNIKIDGKYIENQLLINDGWGITEQVCFKENIDDYVLLEHFGIQEQNVIMVDAHNVANITHQLLQIPVIGFDSEFDHYFDEFSPGGVAILQLATKDNIFIFDVLALKDDVIFINFLEELFLSPNIIKIGHSIKNDIHELAINIKFTRVVEPQNMVDLVNVFNSKIQSGQQSVSLANQVIHLLGKKLSKSETFSNWARRPLRKCQQYYAAMDAYICIVLYDQLLTQDQKSVNIQPKIKDKKEIIREQNFRYSVQYADILKQQKFLIDTMLKKLVGFLRNLGLDCAYMEKNDHDIMESIALKEGRIIVTRDKKFFEKPSILAPCFYIPDNFDTDGQYQLLKDKFSLSGFNLLSRCVKCNSQDIILINKDQAKELLHFSKADAFDQISEFWQCCQCKQVYWEGAQFKNSMERFNKVIQNQ